jgi:3-deoxy-7-phosphoheptulonate synthase
LEQIRRRNEEKGLSLLEAVAIDVSHDNSGKNHKRQIAGVEDVASQLNDGELRIKLVMIESNIHAGAQKAPANPSDNLEYGKSITDGCVGLDDSRQMLNILAKAVRARRVTLSQ